MNSTTPHHWLALYGRAARSERRLILARRDHAEANAEDKRYTLAAYREAQRQLAEDVRLRDEAWQNYLDGNPGYKDWDVLCECEGPMAMCPCDPE